MPFPYYFRLSKSDQAIYRRSDAVVTVTLPQPAGAAQLLEDLERSLTSNEQPPVQSSSENLVRWLAASLGVGPVAVTIHERRPSNDREELHGLYTREEAQRPRIQCWMRTAAHGRPVAFRTFLRTLLHEFGHHADYELLELADSFHTEGFFKRENHLFRQLVPVPPERAPAADPSPQAYLPGLEPDR